MTQDKNSFRLKPSSYVSSEIPDLDAAYREMAVDSVREQEALEWIQGTIGDVGEETW